MAVTTLAERGIDSASEQSIPQFQTYQRTAEQVLELLEKEKRLLWEKVKLYKKENSRDRKRHLFELYDKHYKKIMLGVGGIALAAVLASGASAYVTITHEPQHLSIPQMFVMLSNPITSSLLAGSGLVTLLVRMGYFMDCNGKFQESRRARDAVKQALVQIEDYERTEQLRKLNQQLAALQPGKFRLRERLKIHWLMARIANQEQRIKEYVEEMDRRDHRVLEKESGDVGGAPSYRLTRIESKRMAKRKLDELGIGKYAKFFIDPEGELPIEKKTWKQKVKTMGNQIRAKVYNSKRKQQDRPSEQQRLQQICEQMQKELTGGPTFAALSQLTEKEVENTRRELERLMG